MTRNDDDGGPAWTAELLELGGLGAWTWDLERGRVELSPLALELYGLAADATPTPVEWRARLPRDLLAVDLSLATPDAPEVEVVSRLHLESGNPSWVLERGRVVAWQGETPSRLIGITLDVTQRQESDSRRRELIHELQHRIKNMLAAVRSLARRTAARSETLEAFSAHFEGRLDAIARVQTALAHSAGGRIDLETLIRDEFLRTARAMDEIVTVSGPTVGLRAKVAEPLAMALHELCANAVKFGALSADDGSVDVRWSIEPASERRLVIEWRETGAPLLSLPQSTGFGLDFVQTGLPYETEGSVEVRFEPSGLSCTIRVPLAEEP